MSSGNIGLDQKLTGHTKISQTEAMENEVSLAAKRVTEIPTNMQMRADYNGRTDGNPVYLGHAPKGLASSSNGWLLHKYTYDGNDQCTLRQISYDSWDNRASATYS